MKEITSEMLRILEGETNIERNARRITYSQLRWAAFGWIRDNWCKEAVEQGLVEKLEGIRGFSGRSPSLQSSDSVLINT